MQGSCVRVKYQPRVSGILDSSFTARSLACVLSLSPCPPSRLSHTASLPGRSFVHALCPPVDPGSVSLSLCWGAPCSLWVATLTPAAEQERDPRADA